MQYSTCCLVDTLTWGIACKLFVFCLVCTYKCSCLWWFQEWESDHFDRPKECSCLAFPFLSFILYSSLLLLFLFFFFLSLFLNVLIHIPAHDSAKCCFNSFAFRKWWELFCDWFILMGLFFIFCCLSFPQFNESYVCMSGQRRGCEWSQWNRAMWPTASDECSCHASR